MSFEYLQIEIKTGKLQNVKKKFWSIIKHDLLTHSSI